MSSTKYRILGQVGQGQFGKVLCAVDRQTGLLVALKVLNKRELPTRVFLRELGLLASLQHPNIVSVQTISYTAQERYLVIDYCEGGTLRDLMLQSIHLNLGQRLQIVIDVLKGLDYAHQLEIIHCDLKPENILLTHTDGRWTAKIADFGIARLAAEAGHNIFDQGDTGSPAYMAPERFYSQYSHASDQYAIGVILFELLVGERPFMGLPGQLMTAHLNKVVQMPPEVPFLLRSVLKKSLQKLPQKRFQSTGEMLKAVELAAAVLASEEPVQYAVAPSQRLSAETIPPVIRQEQLTHPLRCLLATGNQVFLGSLNQVISRSYPVTCSATDAFTERQWQFSQPVTDLFWGWGQCWVRTIQGNTSKEPSRLYSLTPEIDPPTQDFDLPPVEGLSGIDWGQNNKIGWRSELGWIAIASSQQAFETSLAPELGNQALLQLFRWPTLQPMHQPVIIHKPHWLFLLDQRYGVAVSSQSNQTQFQGFTRRGTCHQPFLAPIALQQITQSSPNPYRLFAIASDQNQVGFLIDLKPWRLTRITLAIQPEQVVAAPWGYVLIAAGQVLLLGLDGQPLSHFKLHIGSTGKVTALTSTDQGFMLSTLTGTLTTLHTIDVSPILTYKDKQADADFLEDISKQTA